MMCRICRICNRSYSATPINPAAGTRKPTVVIVALMHAGRVPPKLKRGVPGRLGDKGNDFEL